MKSKNAIGTWVGFVLILLWCLFPVAWIISLSFKSEGETATGSAQFLPKEPTLDNYSAILKNDDFTRALINSVPRLGMTHGMLQPIEGSVPDPYNIPRGCAFHPRCPSFIPGRCDVVEPQWTPLSAHHQVRCHLYE